MTDFDFGESGQKVGGVGFRVVLYLRQSSGEQKLSIGEQRAECMKFAKLRGWKFVREFVDDGKSGSKNITRRAAFHAMIAEAERANRRWDGILVWDTSRFGRLDSFTSAEFKQRLRRAGVVLLTARGEVFDWSRREDRINDVLKSEEDSQYSINLSRSVIRGRRAVLDMGFWATRCPFGFDRQYVDENGRVRMKVDRQEKFSKPRNWRLRPVVNKTEARVVRWLFDQWRDHDVSFTATMKLLFEKGIPSPSGRPSWTLHQVKTVLTEQAYCGDAVIGDGEKTQEVIGRIGKRVKEGVIPAIVDRKTFAVVQRKVKEREGAEWRPKSASGPLSGVLKCGKCGYTLAKRTYGGRVKYVCESALRRPEHGCAQWRVDEQEILPIVARELVQAVDWAMLSRIRTGPERRGDPRDTIERLKKDEARQRQKLERATKNVLLATPATAPALHAALVELQQEYERTANALKLAGNASSDHETDGLVDWIGWWKANKTTLVRLDLAAGMPPLDPKDFDSDWIDDDDDAEGIMLNRRAAEAWVQGEPPPVVNVQTFRALLRRLNVQVHFWWGRHGTRNWKLTTGVIRAVLGSTATKKPVLGAKTAAGVYERDLEVSSQITRSRTACVSSCATWRTASSTAAPPPPTRRGPPPSAGRCAGSSPRSPPTASPPATGSSPPPPR